MCVLLAPAHDRSAEHRAQESGAVEDETAPAPLERESDAKLVPEARASFRSRPRRGWAPEPDAPMAQAIDGKARGYAFEPHEQLDDDAALLIPRAILLPPRLA